MADSPDDFELLRRMRDGDEGAFVALYRRRQGGVYRFALQMCGSASVAEDVTQEVFAVLVQDGGANYDPARGTLASYLYGVARNQVLRALRRERAYVQVEGDGEDDDGQDSFGDKLAAPGGDLLGDLTRRETIEQVRQAVLALPPHYREAVVLCYLHEMSYAEAADVLNCAVGTVRSRLHRARSMLVERLGAANEVKSEGEAARGYKAARCFA